jgi:hypothetical protein
MGKDEFREALFNAVEVLVDHRLSIGGRSIIMSYFNDAAGRTTLERAVAVMEKYSGTDFPPLEERNKKLKTALNRLAYEAERWDRE